MKRKIIHLLDTDNMTTCGVDPAATNEVEHTSLITLDINGVTCVDCLRKYATQLYSCLAEMRDRFVPNNPGDPLIQEADHLLSAG
jgi:hypothetical protein